MKLHKLLLPLAFVGLASCSGDFFNDVDRPYITQQEKDALAASPESKPRLIQSEIEALYKELYRTTGDASFGLKTVQLATDLTGEDMVQTKHHFFGFDYNIDFRLAEYSRTSFMWNLFYKVIATSNDFITKYLSDEKSMTPEVAAVKAELLTVRGVAFYYLINLYQQTYKGNEDAPGVPLTLPGSDPKLPRAKVSEVYAQIVKDLTYGMENGEDTPGHVDADKRVAAAYLAKAYAAMEDWPNVEAAAKVAFQGKSLAFPSNFDKLDNDDALWGAEINDQNTGFYGSFFSHMDSSAPGYAGALSVFKAIHNKLYDQIPAIDVRKKWWNPKVEYANTKFNSLDDFTGDYIYIRTADPYLLYVEALAEQGKKAEAAAALKDFLVPRGVSSLVDEHQNDLRDFIRLQRRIELWGEGTSFFDLKRWKLGINRSVEGTNHGEKIDVAPGGVAFVYQIPKREVDQNDKLVQNP